MVVGKETLVFAVIAHGRVTPSVVYVDGVHEETFEELHATVYALPAGL
mgnify:FL=1